MTSLMERLEAAISDDDCAICGKRRAQHSTSCGVGICHDEVVEQSVARALYRVFEEREPPTEYKLQGQWIMAARAALAAMPAIDRGEA